MSTEHIESTTEGDLPSRELDYYPIDPFYDSLSALLTSIQLATQRPVSIDSFNRFCTTKIRATVADQLLEEDLTHHKGPGKKSLAELKSRAESASGSLFEEFNKDSSPFITPVVASKFFNFEYKHMYRAIAGDVNEGIPPILPASRVGWQWRIPGSAIVLFEGAGRINPTRREDLAEYEQDAYERGDLRAIAKTQGALIPKYWREYMEKSGLRDRTSFYEETQALYFE